MTKWVEPSEQHMKDIVAQLKADGIEASYECDRNGVYYIVSDDIALDAHPLFGGSIH